jgi:FkbM family methyltransferase
MKTVRRLVRHAYLLVLYRANLFFQASGIARLLQRSPRMRVVVERIKRPVKVRLVPRTKVWVRVQSGLSEGMWIRVRLPEEANYWRGTHEMKVQNAISSLLLPGTVVYDVGAHVGIISLGAAKLVGGTGHVVAFEPDPENAAALHESVLLNHFQDRMQIVQAAVWSHSEPGGIAFRRSKTHASQGGVLADANEPVLASGDVIQVPAIRLDDFIATGAPAPDLIKIDVEGGEYEVLCGGLQLFQSERPDIIVEVHHSRAAEQIAAWLERYRYRGDWDIPHEGFPRTLFGEPVEAAGRSRNIRISVNECETRHRPSA